MSRCFPYPPPGYAGKCTSNEALILSIKLQQEKEKAKSGKKKDRKKEKKEKKRDDKANRTFHGEKKFIDEKVNQADKYGSLPKVCIQSKQQESSYELMEKSSLTEEHGRPCCSSDSTENSSKRKRSSLPATSNNARNHGTVIRIRLSTQKREIPPTITSNSTAVCSASGRVDSLSQKADASVKNLTTPSLRIPPPPLSINATLQGATGSDKEAPLLTSNASLERMTVSHKEAPSCSGKGILKESSSKDEVKLPRALRKYKGLFDNWAPPTLASETVDDDQEWLFSTTKHETGQPAKRLKSSDEEVPSCGSLALQPRALFLNGADVYALPYTVPF